MSVEILSLATLIVIVGSVLQASVGFGFGVIVVPALFLLDPRFIPVPLIFSSLFLMCYVAYQNRFSLAGHNIVSLLAGLAIDAPIGAFLLAILDYSGLKIVIVALVILGLVFSFMGTSVKVSTEQLVMGAFLLPGMLVGAATGNKLSAVIDQGHSRIAILVLSTISVLLVMLKS